MADYRKILVLLDLSEGSRKVFEAGRAMASRSGASLVALHVVDHVPLEPMGESLMPSMAIEQELVHRSREKLQQLVAGSGIADARGRVEMGNPKAEILRVAEEERTDLIVLGARERHGLAILVNFTEDTVLHGAHCDVLAVRLS